MAWTEPDTTRLGDTTAERMKVTVVGPSRWERGEGEQSGQLKVVASGLSRAEVWTDHSGHRWVQTSTQLRC